jgi:ATP-dependent Lhr-like helicase
VGELDEEMVLESRVGEVFLLGASSWRIEEITHDRVLVSPAPGEPGKMPFWRGDKVGRPVELGLAIGQLAREIAAARRKAAEARLEKELGLEPKAARNLVAYVHEQKDATTDVPSDRTVIVERFTDEVGDERVCILSTLGARVHAPWAIAVLPRLREELGAEVDALWTDDGLVFRLPAVPRPPPLASFFPEPDHVEEAVVQTLGGTALFAAHFRENAARALLLPRRMPGKRNPLWAQRKKAGDLLQVASRYESFPIVLETYRECLRDVFDLPALVDLLRRVRTRAVRVVDVGTRTPSPFASALVFGYVASFLYEGDTPLAERRAQALAIDHARLRELLGEAELRELLDPEAIAAEERRLQRLEGRRAKSADAVHDLLLALGDLAADAIRARAEPELDVDAAIAELLAARRIARLPIAGEPRLVAMEDVGRYRDALGVVPPLGAPAAFLERVADPVGDLVSRYARTHGPFAIEALASRFGLGVAAARAAASRLVTSGKLLEGGFLPGGAGVELCDAEVLRSIKRRSLARLRQQVEPVPHAALGRFLAAWHEIGGPRGGLDAVLSVVEQLEGCPIPATALFEDVLPARVRGFRPDQLDALCAAGEIVWRGVEAVGEGDGRVALHLVDRYALLAAPPDRPEEGLALRAAEVLAARGAIFFGDLVAALGAFPGDVLSALWDLVWRGAVTNDTMAPLRSRAGLGPATTTSRRQAFRSRRVGAPGSEGRWSLLPGAARALGLDTHAAEPAPPSDTERRAALAAVLLERYGVVTREVAHAEGIVGGFSAVYDVLKAMEEAGRARRGWFVADLGAAQFARPASEDRLRALREPPEEREVVVLAATDPASPYGAALPWPATDARPQRAAGALVVLSAGELVGWIGRGEKTLATFLPADEPDRHAAAVALATGLAAFVDAGRRQALTIERIDGGDATGWHLAPVFVDAGWQSTSKGLLKRREGVFASRRRR